MSGAKNKAKKNPSPTSFAPSSGGKGRRSHKNPPLTAEEKNRIQSTKVKQSTSRDTTDDDDGSDQDSELEVEENDENSEGNNSLINSSALHEHQASFKSKQQQQNIPEPKNSSFIQTLVIIGFVVILPLLITTFLFSNSNSDDPSKIVDWRLKVDPDDHLSNHQRSVARASLKPILDTSSSNQDEGVSTLLILSSNEEAAAKLARCLLQIVNKKTHINELSTEIDLRSHYGGKLTLDSNLRTLLTTNDAIRAVLLRRINDIRSEDAFNQLRLLFAYCDGENPVVPHRLIIMTATSKSEKENELRENFKARWPAEHDFIDALMSRISGHVLYVTEDQRSIC